MGRGRGNNGRKGRNKLIVALFNVENTAKESSPQVDIAMEGNRGDEPRSGRVGSGHVGRLKDCFNRTGNERLDHARISRSVWPPSRPAGCLPGSGLQVILHKTNL